MGIVRFEKRPGRDEECLWESRLYKGAGQTPSGTQTAKKRVRSPGNGLQEPQGNPSGEKEGWLTRYLPHSWYQCPWN